MHIPTELKYTSTHEWVRFEKDGLITVGITEHAQHLLGELVYVELPPPGKVVQAGNEVAVVESVKAASDVYAPLAGEVVATNDQLTTTPQLVNQAPFGEGWLFQLKPANTSEFETLLTAEQYQQQL